MAKNTSPHRIGHYAFLLGIALAIVVGLVPLEGQTQSAVSVVLVVLGLIVGFLNISARETTEFLVAAITLIAAGLANSFLVVIPSVGVYLQAIIGNIVVFVAPAAIVVALKAVKTLADR